MKLKERKDISMKQDNLKTNENRKIWHYSDLVSPFNQSKILVHADKLIELSTKKIVAPICCEIDLVDGFCNNKCKHCFFGTNEKFSPVLMDTIRAKQLIDELNNLGVKGIELSGGGEPTTHPNIKEIVTYAYKLGMDIGIVTNGCLLEQLEECYHMFTFIRVSIDAATPETYKKVHGVDCFHKVVENLKRVVKSGNGDKLGVGYLITGTNNCDIIPAAQFFKEIGCRFLQYRPASLKESFPDIIWQESKHLVEEAVKYADHTFQIVDAGIKWEHIFAERQYTKCTTSCLVAVVKANGDVPICVLKRNDEAMCLGNIYENTFKDIYFSKRHEEIIDNNDLSKCRKPCKHDSYNIIHEALCKDYLHRNFV